MEYEDFLNLLITGNAPATEPALPQENKPALEQIVSATDIQPKTQSYLDYIKAKSYGFAKCLATKSPLILRAGLIGILTGQYAGTFFPSYLLEKKGKKSRFDSVVNFFGKEFQDPNPDEDTYTAGMIGYFTGFLASALTDLACCVAGLTHITNEDYLLHNATQEYAGLFLAYLGIKTATNVTSGIYEIYKHSKKFVKKENISDKLPEKENPQIKLPEEKQVDEKAQAYLDSGNAKQDQGKLEEAIQDYDNAIQIQPDFAAAYNNRGNSKFNLGRFYDAIGDYDKAIQLKPDLASAYNNRGVAQSERGLLTDAIRDYDKAIQLKPDLISAYYNRGLAKKDIGKYKDAILDFQKCLHSEYKRDAILEISICKSNSG